jgi:putative endonuclease
MFYAYVLKSEKDGKYYYGSTSNLLKRLDCQNRGKVRATKSRRPFVLHYSEEYLTRSEAFKREKFFKTIDGYIWLKTMKII